MIFRNNASMLKLSIEALLWRDGDLTLTFYSLDGARMPPRLLVGHKQLQTDKYNKVIGKRAPSKKGGYTP